MSIQPLWHCDGRQLIPFIRSCTFSRDLTVVEVSSVGGGLQDFPHTTRLKPLLRVRAYTDRNATLCENSLRLLAPSYASRNRSLQPLIPHETSAAAVAGNAHRSSAQFVF